MLRRVFPDARIKSSTTTPTEPESRTHLSAACNGEEKIHKSRVSKTNSDLVRGISAPFASHFNRVSRKLDRFLQPKKPRA